MFSSRGLIADAIRADGNPNGVIVGELHDTDGPKAAEQLIASLPLLKSKGFTHIGLEFFKVGTYLGGDESKGLEEYTSGRAEESNSDVKAAFRKATMMDIRNYYLSQGKFIDLTEIYNNLDKGIYQEALDATADTGYRKLLTEMRRHNIIGFGLEPPQVPSQTDHERNRQASKDFQAQVKAIKGKSPQAKLFIECGATHLLSYKPADQDPIVGVAEVFGLSPYFLSEKTREFIKSDPVYAAFEDPQIGVKIDRIPLLQDSRPVERYVIAEGEIVQLAALLRDSSPEKNMEALKKLFPHFGSQEQWEDNFALWRAGDQSLAIQALDLQIEDLADYHRGKLGKPSIQDIPEEYKALMRLAYQTCLQLHASALDQGESIGAEVKAVEKRLFAALLRDPLRGGDDRITERLFADDRYTPAKALHVSKIKKCFLSPQRVAIDKQYYGRLKQLLGDDQPFAPFDNLSSQANTAEGFKEYLEKVKALLMKDTSITHYTVACPLGLSNHMAAMAIDFVRDPGGKIEVKPHVFNSLEPPPSYQAELSPFVDKIGEVFSAPACVVKEATRNTTKLQASEGVYCSDWALWFLRMVAENEVPGKAAQTVLNEAISKIVPPGYKEFIERNREGDLAYLRNTSTPQGLELAEDKAHKTISIEQLFGLVDGLRKNLALPELELQLAGGMIIFPAIPAARAREAYDYFEACGITPKITSGAQAGQVLFELGMYNAVELFNEYRLRSQRVPAASSEASVEHGDRDAIHFEVLDQPSPARSKRSKLIVDPSHLGEQVIFKQPQLTEDEGTKSQYLLFTPTTIEELDQLGRGTPLQPKLGAVASQGTIRLSVHQLPDELQDNTLELSKFVLVESNKTNKSVDSKLILDDKAQAILSKKTDFTSLAAEEKQLLLAVVDKQLETSIAVLQAKGKPIVLTVHASMPKLKKEAYIEYCQSMGYKLKTHKGEVLVKAAPASASSAPSPKKEAIEAFRSTLVDMIKREKLDSSLSPL